MTRVNNEWGRILNETSNREWGRILNETSNREWGRILNKTSNREWGRILNEPLWKNIRITSDKDWSKTNRGKFQRKLLTINIGSGNMLTTFSITHQLKYLIHG